jgi:hypothetical protein
VLQRLGIAQRTTDNACVSLVEAPGECPDLERLWRAAQREETIRSVAEYLDAHTTADGDAIATHIAGIKSKWSKASRVRVGNGLRQWAEWTLRSTSADPVPPIPRRRRIAKKEQIEGPMLFDTEVPTHE